MNYPVGKIICHDAVQFHQSDLIHTANDHIQHTVDDVFTEMMAQVASWCNDWPKSNARLDPRTTYAFEPVAVD